MKNQILKLLTFFFIITSCGVIDKVEEVDKWSNVILGKWKYDMIYDETREKQLINGEVEYFLDSTFIRTVTVRVFFTSYGEVSTTKGFEDIIAGGIVKGRWYIDTEKEQLIESVEECKIKNAHLGASANKDYDACSWYSGKLIYGNNLTDFSKTELLNFSNKKIETKVTNFSSNGITNYSATK